MNGAPGDAHAGQLRRRGPAVGDGPVDEKGRGHDVAQEAEARHDGREGPPLGNDVEELDLQQIARAGALDQDRPREGMNHAQRQGREVGHGGARRHVAIHRVAGLEHDLLALVHLDRRGDVGMPAVVPGPRLIGEMPAPVDLDGLGHVGTSLELRDAPRGQRRTSEADASARHPPAQPGPHGSSSPPRTPAVDAGGVARKQRRSGRGAVRWSAMSTARRLHHTYAEYMALEDESPIRHEYLDGEIYAMAGGSPDHAALAGAIIGLLRGQLPRGCRTFTSDLRVRVPATGLSTYPDASVVCGRTQRAADDPLAVTNPVVIIEVTSASTEEYDRGEKLRHYQSLPSVREVLIVSHARPELTVHRRETAGAWTVLHAASGDTLELVSLGARLAVDDVYRDGLEDVDRSADRPGDAAGLRGAELPR